MATKSTEKLTQKQCVKCLLTKNISDFYSTRSGQPKGACKRCTVSRQRELIMGNPETRRRKVLKAYEWRDKHRERYLNNHRQWASSSPLGVYTRLKRTSKKRGHRGLISREVFVEWYKLTPRVCVYCGIPEEGVPNLTALRGKKLTVDRVDSSQGYVEGNIVLACMTCNTVKSDVFTFDEMKKIGEEFIKPKFI